MIGVGASAGILGSILGMDITGGGLTIALFGQVPVLPEHGLGLRARCASRSWIHRRIGAFLDRLIIFVDTVSRLLGTRRRQEIQLCAPLQRRAEGM